MGNQTSTNNANADGRLTYTQPRSHVFIVKDLRIKEGKYLARLGQLTSAPGGSVSLSLNAATQSEASS